MTGTTPTPDFNLSRRLTLRIPPVHTDTGSLLESLRVDLAEASPFAATQVMRTLCRVVGAHEGTPGLPPHPLEADEPQVPDDLVEHAESIRAMAIHAAQRGARLRSALSVLHHMNLHLSVDQLNAILPEALKQLCAALPPERPEPQRDILKFRNPVHPSRREPSTLLQATALADLVDFCGSASVLRVLRSHHELCTQCVRLCMRALEAAPAIDERLNYFFRSLDPVMLQLGDSSHRAWRYAAKLTAVRELQHGKCLSDSLGLLDAAFREPLPFDPARDEPIRSIVTTKLRAVLARGGCVEIAAPLVQILETRLSGSSEGAALPESASEVIAAARERFPTLNARTAMNTKWLAARAEVMFELCEAVRTHSDSSRLVRAITAAADLTESSHLRMLQHSLQLYLAGESSDPGLVIRLRELLVADAPILWGLGASYFQGALAFSKDLAGDGPLPPVLLAALAQLRRDEAAFRERVDEATGTVPRNETLAASAAEILEDIVACRRAHGMEPPLREPAQLGLLFADANRLDLARSYYHSAIEAVRAVCSSPTSCSRLLAPNNVLAARDNLVLNDRLFLEALRHGSLDEAHQLQKDLAVIQALLGPDDLGLSPERTLEQVGFSLRRRIRGLLLSGRSERLQVDAALPEITADVAQFRNLIFSRANDLPALEPVLRRYIQIARSMRLPLVASLTESVVRALPQKFQCQ